MNNLINELILSELYQKPRKCNVHKRLNITLKEYYKILFVNLGNKFVVYI